MKAILRLKGTDAASFEAFYGCEKHKDPLTPVKDMPVPSTKGQNLEKDGAVFIEAGKGVCRYCKKEDQEIAFPEFQARIF